MDKRSQSVLTHALGNIAERNIGCLRVKIEKRGDLQKKTRVFIAPVYQKRFYQCAEFCKLDNGETSQHDKG